MATSTQSLVSSGIDPITVSRLSAFGRRRRGLILLRGFCAGVAVLIGGLLLIALLDWRLVLPDPVRWGLTFSVYGAAIVAVWLTCLRMMVRVPSQKDLARLVEHVQPDLREDLLSAIELGSTDFTASFDSPEFRAMLQSSVAERMRALDVGSLLPVKMVVRWVRGMAILVAACVALSLVPGMPLGRLIMRAALPMANIARISNVFVHILEPAPASRAVPLGETVPVVVQVSKEQVRVATLETRQSGKGRQRTSMTARGGRVFAASVATGDSPIEYRVIAGDAVTQWNQLSPHPSPLVAGFVKTFHYPEYTAMPAAVRQENDGALSALQGTEVDLEVKTDQPCTGSLLIDTGKSGSRAIPLQTDAQGRLHAVLPIEATGAYQVHLVAATGLPNTFSPRYEIQALPDLPPRAELRQPATNRLLQPDEILPVSGSAEDDLGLAKVEQWVQVNGSGQWSRLPLTGAVGRQTPITAQWDLLKLHLEPGDLVTTKLVATDKKGQTGESPAIQLTVNFKEMNGERLATLRAKTLALETLDQLSKTAAEQWKAMAHGADADPTATSVQSAREAIGKLNDAAMSAFYQINQIIQRVPKGADVYELTQVNRVVASVIHESCGSAMARLEHLDLSNAKDTRQHLSRARGDLDSAQRQLKTTGDSYRQSVGVETTAVVLNDLHALVREQTRLVRDDQPLPDDPMVLRRLARVLDIVDAQTTQDEHLLGGLDPRLGQQRASDLQQVARNMSASRAGTERVVADVLAEERGNAAAQPLLGPWHVIGPFPAGSYRQTFDSALEPERKIDLAHGAGTLAWTSHPEWSDGTNHALSDEKGTAWYLYRTIQAPAALEMPFLFGSNEGIKAWLNGELILEGLPYRYIKPDQDKRMVRLQPGQNNLLIKIVSNRNVPAFAFRAPGAVVPNDLDRLNPPGERLVGASRSMHDSLRHAIEQIDPTFAALESDLTTSRHDLTQLAAPVAERIARLDAARQRAFKRSRGDWEAVPDAFSELVSREWPVAAGFVRDCSVIGETRPEADSRFFADTGSAARALDNLLLTVRRAPSDPAAAAAAGEKTHEVAGAYRVLEVVHNVNEIATTTEELTSLERWGSQSPGAFTRNITEWSFAAQRMSAVARQIEEARLSPEAASLLKRIPATTHGKAVEEEMQRRLARYVEPASAVEPLRLVNADLAQVIALLAPSAEQARRELAPFSLSLPDMMKLAAQGAKKLQQATEQATAKATDAELARKSADLRQEQRGLDQLVGNIVDALRQDANVQDRLVAEQRERARDADDAIAMIRPPASRADAHYRLAADDDQAARQKHNLDEGAQQEAKLSDTLAKLTDHYKRLDADDQVANSRPTLRKVEDELDTRQDMDREYGQVARLAQLAEIARIDDPEKLTKALEKELASNPAMQRELNRIARNTAKQALRDLDEAADKERQLAQKLHDAALATGELKPELQQQADALQKRIAELATKDVPEVSAASESAKVASAKAPLDAAREATDSAVKAAPEKKTDASAAAALDEQAKALDAAAHRLAEASRAATEAERGPDLKQQLAALQRQISRLASDDVPDAARVAQVNEAGPATRPIASAQQHADEAARGVVAPDEKPDQVVAKLNQQVKAIETAAKDLDDAAAAAGAQAKEQNRPAAVLERKMWALQEGIKRAAAKTGKNGPSAESAADAMKAMADAQAQVPAQGESLRQLSERLDAQAKDLERASAGFAKVAGDAERRADAVAREMAGKVATAAAKVAPMRAEAAKALADVNQAAAAAREASAKAKADSADGNLKKLADKAAREAQAATRAADEARRRADSAAREADTLRRKADLAEKHPRDEGNRARTAQEKTKPLAEQARALADAAKELADGKNPNLASDDVPAPAQKVADKASAAKARAVDLAQQARALAEQMTHPAPAADAKARGTAPSPAADAADKAKSAAEKAQQLSEAAGSLAEEMAKASATSPADAKAQKDAAIQKAGEEQDAVAQQVKSAGDALARAAEHAEELADRSQAGALRKAADGAKQAASEDVPSAKKQVSAAATAKEGKAAVDHAEQAIRAQAKALQDLVFPNAADAKAGKDANNPAGAPQGEPDVGPLTAQEREVALQLARALDLAQRDKAQKAGAAQKSTAGAARQVAMAEPKSGAASKPRSKADSPTGKTSGAEQSAASAADASKSGGAKKAPGEKAGGAEKSTAKAAEGAKSGSGSGSASAKMGGPEKSAIGAADAAKSAGGSESGDASTPGAEKPTASAADAAKSGSGAGTGGTKGSEKPTASAADAAKSRDGSGAAGASGAEKSAKAADAAKSGSGSGSGGASGAEKSAASAADAAKSGSGSGSGTGGASGATASAADSAKSGGGGSGSSGSGSAEEGGPGHSKGGSVGGSDAAATVASAARSASKAVSKLPAPYRGKPAEAPGGPLTDDNPVGATDDLQASSGRKDWGQLRAQAAKEVSQGEQETVPEAYRASVETYFSVVAREARDAAAARQPASTSTGAPEKEKQ